MGCNDMGCNEDGNRVMMGKLHGMGQIILLCQSQSINQSIMVY